MSENHTLSKLIKSVTITATSKDDVERCLCGYCDKSSTGPYFVPRPQCLTTQLNRMPEPVGYKNLIGCKK
ncbi:hypothetical protein OAG24_00910 [bacterium]|nr:hypothetical protein [bacterium]